MKVFMRRVPSLTRRYYDDGERCTSRIVPVENWLAVQSELVAFYRRLRLLGEEACVLAESRIGPQSRTFVQDTAIVLGRTGLVCSLPDQRGQEIPKIRKTLSATGLKLVDLPSQAKIEGGEIIRHRKWIFVRKGERDHPSCNQAGVSFLRQQAQREGFEVVEVEVKSHIRHLTTGATFAGTLQGQPAVVINSDWVDPGPFREQNWVIIETGDEGGTRHSSANVFPANGHLIVQAGCPQLKRALVSSGFSSTQLIELPWSNVDAAYGGFTCCCLQL